MKIITRKDSHLALYAFDDNESINVQWDGTRVGNPLHLVIADCNLENTVIHQSDNTPDDFIGCKYFFDGKAWTLNPDYTPFEPLAWMRDPFST